MPKKGGRKMKGGFLDSLTNTLSGWGTSISNGASSAWNKTKNAVTSSTSTPSSSYGTPTTTTTTTTTPTTTSSYGGKKKSRKMHGGFKSYTPTNGLASHSASISNVKSAQPHNWVGGRTRKHHGRKHRHSKSCRHHK